MKHNKTLLVIFSTAMILAIGVAALAFTSPVSAMSTASVEAMGPFNDDGNYGMMGEDHTYLAQALGISVDELNTARAAAWTAYLDQAVEDGVITNLQAQALKAADGISRRLGGRMMFGQWLKDNTTITFDELLAAELGISTTELDAARAEAQELRIADLLESGEITQEQADARLAMQALKDVIDRDALNAQALGMTATELQAARDAGQSMSEIITARGMTTAEYQAALQEAHIAAVNQAVTDGVITRAQADAVLNSGLWMRGGMGEGMRGMRGMRGGMGEGMRGRLFQSQENGGNSNGN